MKAISYWAGVAAAGALLAACEKSDKGAASGIPLTLTGPSEKVVLLEANEKDTAVTFSWNRGIDRSPTDTITYIFRMDIAGNNFADATPRDTVTNFTKCYTVGELNELIGLQWGIRPGDEALLEARVVANVRGEKFVYPEIAATSFSVVTYAYASVPLYLMGTAVPAGAFIPLTERVNGRQYEWQGNLDVGNFKFVYNREQELPSLNKGADDHTLIERAAASQPDDRFEASHSGLYSIRIDRKNLKIDVRHYFYYFEHIYFVGDAVPAGWSPENAVQLTWNDGVFTYEGPLTGDGDGEDAFKILTARDWGGYNLRPVEEWAPITDSRLQAVEGGPDLKWKVKPEESGAYRITVDLSNMAIHFEKLD
jgi:hypothetical protein